jgi:hypothetical protein
MPVVNVQSSQISADVVDIRDNGAKIRLKYFDIPANAEEVSAGSLFSLVAFGPGDVRVVPALSRINISAVGSGRSARVGLSAYKKGDGSEEVADYDILSSGFSIATASAARTLGTSHKFDVHSRSGFHVVLQTYGTAISVSAPLVLSGFIAYSLT